MGSISEILIKRFEAFIQNKPDEIYNLYSENSELKSFFPTKDIYYEHFQEIYKQTMPIKIDIVSEHIKGTLAQILSIESFLDSEEGEVIYYTKTILKKEKNSWKILKEIREKHTKRG